MTENEFYKVAKSHIISPNKFKLNETNSKPPKDFKEWSKDGSANRNVSKILIDEWFKNQ